MTLVDFLEAQKLLEENNFPWAETDVFTSFREANQFARKIGFPVVLKVYSQRLIHRTEKRGVITQVSNNKDFKRAWHQLTPFLQKSAPAKIMVQKEEQGLELAAGMKRDQQFGPVVMFGLGGIFIEIFKDVSFRIAPFSRKEARAMIREIKAYPLLKGFRHIERVDLNQLETILVNLSHLSLRHSEIQEVDFNPIIAQGSQVKIVDAKFLKK